MKTTSLHGRLFMAAASSSSLGRSRLVDFNQKYSLPDTYIVLPSSILKPNFFIRKKYKWSAKLKKKKRIHCLQKVYILWCSRHKSSTFHYSARKYPNLARTSHTHSSKSHWSHLEVFSAIDTKLQSVIVPVTS